MKIEDYYRLGKKSKVVVHLLDMDIARIDRIAERLGKKQIRSEVIRMALSEWLLRQEAG